MKQQLAITLGQSSSKGIKDDNEDFYGAYLPKDGAQLENKGITIAIADGMSGSDGGKEASQLSVQQFLTDYYSTPESWTVKHSVNRIMSALNSMLFSQGQKRYSSSKGLVTTFSSMVLKSQTAHLFHVGDSRIYRLRGNDFAQLTNDHRIWISNDREYLSRALGIDSHLEIDYRKTTIQAGDIYFLSTDGVHDFVSDSELREHLKTHRDNPQNASQAILDASVANKSDDNITCQVVRIDAISKANKEEYYEKLTSLPFPPDLKAGNTIDGFKIIRELNATSRSQVYLAEDTFYDDIRDESGTREVVIKTPSVNFEDDPSYIDLFLHEEWVAKRLNSPHLIKVCDLKRQRNFLYTVVEYIHGQTLAQWMQENPKASVTQVRGSITQIAHGLRCMHRMEMIHQDIKPDNIIIDESNTLIIIDFGSTKVAGLAEIKSVVEHNSIVGTANYSAPEYFKGEQGTNSSDIYSLGVIAYEMFTGKLPYGEISPERAAKKKFTYTSAREYNPHVPEWVDLAIRKAVNSNPEKRYDLLSEFVTDLAKPNNSLLSSSKSEPLMERNPLAFWKTIAVIEFILIIVVLLVIYNK
ncbi:MAG TPA: bifunctional protein-serine/threonine kinase/phosphatase [Leucothrix mucor]|nr:bifunctional protein-serine/threonine kinase/phosphatase [Leucothrix mucor]